jgi:hypothetical protein
MRDGGGVRSRLGYCDRTGHVMLDKAHRLLNHAQYWVVDGQMVRPTEEHQVVDVDAFRSFISSALELLERAEVLLTTSLTERKG